MPVGDVAVAPGDEGEDDEHGGGDAGERRGRQDQGRELFVFGDGQAIESMRSAYPRTCPEPRTIHFVLVSSGSPIGPRACSF